MNQFKIVSAQLGRKKTRTILTMLSIGIAFILLGFLYAIDDAFNRGVEISGADRLVTIHKTSIIQLLPESYALNIKATPGVKEVAAATWFGGFYQDTKNFFPKFPVDPEVYLSVYPEQVLAPEQMEAWKNTRTGAVVGRALANRFGWKIGDRIPIEGDIWQKAGGGRMWEFDLVGIYDGATDLTDETQFLFRRDYFEEAKAFGKGLVGWYIVQLENPQTSAEVARAIDQQFANSPAETKTSSEAEFNKAFAKQFGDIGMIVRAILGAVFFTIILVTGNTVAQSVRERTREIGVLKTLGFSGARVALFILAETLLLIMIPAFIGLFIAKGMLQGMSSALQNFLPHLAMPLETWLIAIIFAVGIAIISGVPSATNAFRLRIADALGRG